MCGIVVVASQHTSKTMRIEILYVSVVPEHRAPIVAVFNETLLTCHDIRAAVQKYSTEGFWLNGKWISPAAILQIREVEP